MDTLNHGVQSFLITAIPVTLITNGTAGSVAGAVYGVVGMLPDLVGEYYAHFKENNGYKYYLYGMIHTPRYMKVYVRIILFTWYFHILQDSFLHIVGKRWWVLKERAWYEILTWIINLILLLTLIKIL